MTAQVDLNSFFSSGAILQLSPDLFKLITGPFKQVSLVDIQTHDQECVIYQPHFWDFLTSRASQAQGLQGTQNQTLSRQQLTELLSEGEACKPQVAWQNVNSDSFKKQFQWSQLRFLEKKLSKTVPIISQASHTQFTPSHLKWVMKFLLAQNNVGWAYGFWQDGQGFFGQTPELVAEWDLKSENFQTSALAGTLQKNSENEELILQDSKILQEHQFVVDDINENLKNYLPTEKIHISPVQVLKLKHMLHLKTDFKCTEINFGQALKLMLSLHPTAALGIYPRVENEMKTFCKMNLQSDRRQFAAPFALIEKGQILCVAGIRNFFFSPSEIRLFSGCGVTAESTYESELEELEIKRESVKRMMGFIE